jgi:hypothetical protein
MYLKTNFSDWYVQIQTEERSHSYWKKEAFVLQNNIKSSKLNQQMFSFLKGTDLHKEYTTTLMHKEPKTQLGKQNTDSTSCLPQDSDNPKLSGWIWNTVECAKPICMELFIPNLTYTKPYEET